ncbi:hypothetical protein TELCIR_01820, partial [Teladorsagia circumcincta]
LNCCFPFQESEGGNTCPFCRYEIKGTNKVVIDQYKANTRRKSKDVAKSRGQSNESEGGNTCPFCRYEIKGTNKVVIDQYKANTRRKSKDVAKSRGQSYAACPDAVTKATSPLMGLPIGPPPPLPPRSNTDSSAPNAYMKSHDPVYVNVPAPVSQKVAITADYVNSSLTD